jgi:hypothetical protein
MADCMKAIRYVNLTMKYMQHGKDLNWLSAPAFFLIIGMLVINTKKQNVHSRQPEKVKTVISATASQKPL